ncbi:MAG: hypothetical protein A2900_00815 [Candidatus Chisholmbacteria bacterium RIFCSPLOWO2_01_FULL_50_28]|uniref:Ribonuclease VapC n=1 Tax=Candidatus Chisholmbacteria bacterium RIFCSPHIGHO2_01_FULL_52_32 TaxID=1797591 RepID=A0A1G1VUE3_9BACT|nr:MAG: hypothetical protein A2786_05875 [Candidatus Chisholmbacteria bacterium RIFCSPHIGHO2_01_FULL_52_32]OGY19630.1 MAG: hypothetical protein A2900_00815 [Candidatus Chisholmbacteria bacterium RIFCSPLOWO2_01_FULL_50_28]
MEKYLVDTTVLVDHLRGSHKATSFLLKFFPSISHVTVAELIQGTENKREQQAVKQAIRDLNLLPITTSISNQAIALLSKFFLSHNLQFLDALIAATALEENLILITSNAKHFSSVKRLRILNWKDIEAEH